MDFTFFRATETGQLFLAIMAYFWKSSFVIPGTDASVASLIDFISKPSASLSMRTLAVVVILAGLNPALPSIMERAMEKHPECAAPINSSGFVPEAFSNREENE